MKSGKSKAGIHCRRNGHKERAGWQPALESEERMQNDLYNQSLPSVKLHRPSIVEVVAEKFVRRRQNSWKREAAKLAAWANVQTQRCNSLLREIGQNIRLAKELDDFELVDSFEREWRDLEELAEDLQTVKLIIELYARRSVIEALLEDAQPDEPPQPFPRAHTGIPRETAEIGNG